MPRRRGSRSRKKQPPQRNNIADYISYMMMQNLMRGMPSADQAAQRQAVAQRDLISDVREDDWREYQKAQAALQETRVQERHEQTLTAVDEDRITGIFMAGKQRGAQEGWSPAREATEFAKLIAAHPESAEFLGTLNMTVGYGPTTTEQMAHFWGTGTDIDGRMADLKSSEDFVKFAVERWKTKGPEIYGAQWEDQEFRAIHDFAMDNAWYSDPKLAAEFKAWNPELWSKIGEDITYAIDFVGGLTNDFNWSQQQKQDRLAAEVTQAETVTRAQKDIEAEYAQDNVYGLMPTGEGQFEWVQGIQGPKGDVKWQFGPEDSRIPMGMDAHIKGPFGPNVFSNWQQLEGRNWGRDAESEAIAALVQDGMTEGMSPEDARQFVSQFQSEDPTGRWGQNIVGPGMHPGPITLPGAVPDPAALLPATEEAAPASLDFSWNPTGDEFRSRQDIANDLRDLYTGGGLFGDVVPRGEGDNQETVQQWLQEEMGGQNLLSVLDRIVTMAPEEVEDIRDIHNEALNAWLPDANPMRQRWAAGPGARKLTDALQGRTAGREEAVLGPIPRDRTQGTTATTVPREESVLSELNQDRLTPPGRDEWPLLKSSQGGGLLGIPSSVAADFMGIPRNLNEPGIRPRDPGRGEDFRQSPLSEAMAGAFASDPFGPREDIEQRLDVLRQLPGSEVSTWQGGPQGLDQAARHLQDQLKQMPNLFAGLPNIPGRDFSGPPPPPRHIEKNLSLPGRRSPFAPKPNQFDLGQQRTPYESKSLMGRPPVGGISEGPANPWNLQDQKGIGSQSVIPPTMPIQKGYTDFAPKPKPQVREQFAAPKFDLTRHLATPSSQGIPPTLPVQHGQPWGTQFPKTLEPKIDTIQGGFKPQTALPPVEPTGEVAPPIPDIVGSAQRGAVDKIFPGMEGNEAESMMNILRAVGVIESGGTPDPRIAEGTKGEKGRYQFMENTAREYGRDPANFLNWTEEQQAEMAARYMLDLMNRYGSEYGINSIADMLSAYNQGQGAHRSGGRAADPYVRAVLAELGEEHLGGGNQYMSRMFGGGRRMGNN